MSMFKLKDGREVDIRRIRANDFEMVRDFIRFFSTETIFTNQYPGQPDIQKEKSQAAYEDEAGIFIGAFDGKRMVGITNVKSVRPGHPWSGQTCSFGLTILKEFYGVGLGSKLMDEMIAWAKNNNMHRIEAHVRCKNLAAIALYLKKGFLIEGTRYEDAFINGEWHHSYYIAKILD